MPTGESKTAKVAYLTGHGLACAILAAATLGGCTQDLSQDITVVNNNESPFALFLVRDDYYNEDGVVSPIAPTYHFKVDGKFATWDASTYVSIGPGGFSDLSLPAGTHVLALVDDKGTTVATSPTFETKPTLHPGDAFFKPSVVFYGDETTMNVRVFVDDVAAVPATATHVRVMNALADHQPVQVVQCPAEAGGTTMYTASACTQVGNAIAHGDLFEMDASADVLAKLGFAVAAPGAVDPGVNAFTYGPSSAPSNGTTDRFVTRIPVQVTGPASACPSCLITVY